MRAFPILRSLGYPVVYDVTHSLQLPGARGRRHRRPGGVHRADGLAPASPPAWTACSWKSTRIRRGRRATRRTRCGSTCCEPLLDRLVQIHDIARGSAPHEPRPATGARAGPQGPPDRGGAILGLVDRLDGDFERAVQLLFECRGRVIVTGMGKSGHHLPQDRGDALEHRHLGASSSTPPKRSTAISAPSAKTTWCWRCRTAARPRSWSGCSNRSAGSARKLIAITGDPRRRWRGPPTSRSTAASPKRRAR